MGLGGFTGIEALWGCSMGLGKLYGDGGSVGQVCSDSYPGHGKYYVGRRPPLVGQRLWGTAPGRAHRLPLCPVGNGKSVGLTSRAKFGVLHVHTLMCFILGAVIN